MKKVVAFICSKCFIVYLIGIVVLAFGITLNTKTGLGVSPIISVAYCVAEISGLRLGLVTFVWYMLMIALQAIMLGHEFKPFQLLQIGVSFLTSWFIDLFNGILPDFTSMPLRLGGLAAAILITSLGIVLTVGMKVVPNPADGFASVLGQKLGRDLGFGKNVFDLSSILISVTVGLVVAGRLVGIGAGTVLTMIFTGRAVALINRVWGKEFCTRIVEQRGAEQGGAESGDAKSRSV